MCRSIVVIVSLSLSFVSISCVLSCPVRVRALCAVLRCAVLCAVPESVRVPESPKSPSPVPDSIDSKLGSSCTFSSFFFVLCLPTSTN